MASENLHLSPADLADDLTDVRIVTVALGANPDANQTEIALEIQDLMSLGCQQIFIGATLDVNGHPCLYFEKEST